MRRGLLAIGVLLSACAKFATADGGDDAGVGVSTATTPDATTSDASSPESDVDVTPVADGGPGPNADADADADADSTVYLVDITQGWSWPNGAGWETPSPANDGYFGSAGNGGYPVVLQGTPPQTSTTDYTVLAVITAPKSADYIPAEFGIITRVVGQDHGVAFGSATAGTAPAQPYIAMIDKSAWKPMILAHASGSYVQQLGTQYDLLVKAAGTSISAKLWRVGDPEPASWQVQYTLTAAPGASATGVGFFSRGYGVTDAVLESMAVTVP